MILWFWFDVRASMSLLCPASAWSDTERKQLLYLSSYDFSELLGYCTRNFWNTDIHSQCIITLVQSVAWLGGTCPLIDFLYSKDVFTVTSFCFLLRSLFHVCRTRPLVMCICCFMMTTAQVFPLCSSFFRSLDLFSQGLLLANHEMGLQLRVFNFRVLAENLMVPSLSLSLLCTCACTHIPPHTGTLNKCKTKTWSHYGNKN